MAKAQSCIFGDRGGGAAVEVLEENVVEDAVEDNNFEKKTRKTKTVEQTTIQQWFSSRRRCGHQWWRSLPPFCTLNEHINNAPGEKGNPAN